MKLESVAGAIEYSKGQPIPGITGKVVKVWNQDEKSRTDGETYLKQGVVIADLNSPKTEITINFYDHAAYDQSITGKVITITPGPKGGLKSAGPWKEKHYLDCSKACDVTFDGPPAARPQASAQRAAAPAAPQQAPSRNAGATWSDHIAGQGLILRKAINEARQIAREIEMEGGVDGGALSSDNIVAIAMNIVISGERSGLSIDSPMGSAPEPEDNVPM